MSNDVVRFGPFRLDRGEKLLFRDGEAVALTPKAFEMLDFLVQNAGRVVEKEPLMRGVWPDTFVDEANLAHHVFTLRRALGDDREGNRFIETIPRRGYRFVAEVEGDDTIIDEQLQERVVIEEEVAAPPRLLVPLLILVTLASVGALAWTLLRSKPAAAESKSLRFSISPPAGAGFRQFPATQELAVSPDGRTLVMVVLEGEKRRLFVRRFDGLEAKPVAGTDDAVSPFWSPDGKWIGFFAGGSMKKVPLDGGPVMTICEARGGTGSWNANGQILFFEWGPTTSDSVRLVQESGGPVRDLTDAKKGWALWPSFLPDGKHFVFFWLRKENRGLYIGSLDGGEPKFVERVNSGAVVRGDDIYYVRGGVLVRQKLDLKTFTTSGDPTPIAEGVFCFTTLGAANFSLSNDASVIVWQRRMLATQLVWRDWNGREIARVGTPALFRKMSLSPDEKRLATDIEDPSTEIAGIWIFDLDRGVGTRVAQNPVNSSSPFWLPNGEGLMISFGDLAHPQNAPLISLFNLADGSVKPLRADGPAYTNSVTADGKQVIRTANNGSHTEIGSFAIASPEKETVIESSPTFDVSNGVLSPDNRWLAFQSSESGRPEIYLKPFNRAGEKLRISSSGGREPQWMLDGSAILFLNPDGMLTKAEMSRDDAPKVTKETILFPISSAGMMTMQSLGDSHYVVARDRILTREIPGGADVDPVTVLFTGSRN